MTDLASHQTDDDLLVLDNPAWWSLTGRHRSLSEGTERVRRFLPGVSAFGAAGDWDDPLVWRDIVQLVGPDADFPFAVKAVTTPEGWAPAQSGQGVQLVQTDALTPARDPEVVPLGEADVPEMLDLVARTRPGRFLPRTRLLGTYLGLRHDGRLVAMAGERLQPDGWTEISAVCTDADLRGRGLATRVVLSVAAGIHERGDRVLLHARATNHHAIRLYEHLGFTERRRTTFGVIRTPAE